jgi:hypothetical protein
LAFCQKPWFFSNCCRPWYGPLICRGNYLFGVESWPQETTGLLCFP